MVFERILRGTIHGCPVFIPAKDYSVRVMEILGHVGMSCRTSFIMNVNGKRFEMMAFGELSGAVAKHCAPGRSVEVRFRVHWTGNGFVFCVHHIAMVGPLPGTKLPKPDATTPELCAFAMNQIKETKELDTLIWDGVSSKFGFAVVNKEIPIPKFPKPSCVLERQLSEVKGYRNDTLLYVSRALGKGETLIHHIIEEEIKFRRVCRRLEPTEWLN